ncbi:MAG: SpoIIE family protein phosphatase [Bacteroidales bacterium]|nr:SpoIIE family protein phosphatase [Bacteroidales bacterium]
MYLRDYIKLLIITALVLLIAPLRSYTQSVNTFRKSSYVQNYRLDERGYIVKCFQMGEDANGSIMVVTSSGLKIYNGRSWDRYYNSNKSELVSKLYISPINDFYVSGPDCFGFYEAQPDGTLKFNPIEVPFSSRAIKQIYGCHADTARIVCVLDDGLAIVGNETVMRSLDDISTSVECNLGIILLCNNGNLYSYFNSALCLLGNVDKLGIKATDLKMSIIDGDRLLLVGDNFNAYEIRLQRLLSPETLTQNDVTHINLGNDNFRNCVVNDIAYNRRLRKIALATNNGIYVYSNRYEYLQKIDRDLILPLNEISNVYFDSKNNLWAAYAGGVSKIELNVPYVFYFSNQGINGSVLSAYADDKYYYAGTVSAIYVSSHEKAGKNSSFVQVPYDHSTTQNFCWEILNVDGAIIACTSDGLYQIYPDKAVHCAATSRTYGAITSPLYPGKLFITGFDGFKVADYVVKNGHISISNIWRFEEITRPLFKIKIADNGTIWCTSLSDGLVRLVPKGSTLRDFETEYISSNYGLHRTNQLTVEVINNQVYVNDGLFKRVKNTSPSEPLVFEPDSALNKCLMPDEVIYHFAYSKKTDELFVYSQNACRRINLSNPDINSVIHFRVPLGTVYNIAIMDSILLYSTNLGLVKNDITDTTSFNPARQPFNILINSIMCNGKPFFHGYRYFSDTASVRNYNKFSRYDSSGKLTDTICNVNCEYADNHVVISFSTTSFENVETILYSYKLEGLDSDWSAWQRGSVKEYTNIPSGSYVFKVKARNCENVESSIATFSFTIVPPFYASIGAIIIYVLLAALFVYLLIRRRTAKFKNTANDLSVLLQQRNKQLEDQNERLRQMSFVATRSTNSVIIMDKDGNIQWTNDSFKNVYGCSFDEFLYIHGRNYFDSYLSSDKKNQELIQLARQSNQNVTYETCHRFYSNVNWVQASLDTVFDDNGNLCNWILTETDITMLKRAQEEGSRQASQLTEAFMQLQENQLQIEMQKEQLFLKNSELEKGYKKIEVQNNAITNSLRYAQQMQQSILPLNESISQYFDHFVIYMPKDIVSGDFYWFEPLPDGSLIFVVADCTGHGVPGAFMSLIGYNLLNEIIMIQDITQPKQIFENLSQGLINVLKQERNQNYDGMEVRLCRFVPFGGKYKVTFCGTGSSIFYYDSEKDEMQRIKGVHRHLGLTDETVIDNDFEEHEFIFKHGDKLFMITDGLVDQNNPQRKRFGTERFIRFVTQHRNNSVVDTGNTLAAELNAFMDGQPQRDDITVVGLSIKQ